MKHSHEGDTFGRLTVISMVKKTGKRGVWWLCLCACGNTKTVSGYSLRTSRTRSCGCLRRELASARATIHGAVSGGKWTPEYRAWVSLKTRCKYAHRKDFKWYGARGITVCPEWQNDFAAFLKEIGPRPSPKHSVDRINNDTGYEPGNVRWATALEQRHNTRTIKLTLEKAREIKARLAGGEPRRLLAAAFGVSHYTIGEIDRGERWASA